MEQTEGILKIGPCPTTVRRIQKRELSKGADIGFVCVFVTVVERSSLKLCIRHRLAEPVDCGRESTSRSSDDAVR